MSTATVQKIGDTLMLALPQDLEEEMHLHEGSELILVRAEHQVTVAKRRYTLQELLDRCDSSLPVSDEDRAWEAMKPVGRELL